MTDMTSDIRRVPMLVHMDDPGAATKAAAALRAGQVVAIPTDTVYGLAAAIDQPRAIDRLYSLKGRPISKAVPILLSDADQLDRVTSRLSPLAAALAARYWPGALTLVIPTISDLPESLTSTASDGTRTIAVRVPDHDLARQFIAAAGGAIAVTSANRSGDDPALDAGQVMRMGPLAPDLVVDGGPVRGKTPSTIVLVLPALVSILREGAISVAEVEHTVVEACGRGSRVGPVPILTV